MWYMWMDVNIIKKGLYFQPSKIKDENIIRIIQIALYESW